MPRGISGLTADPDNPQRLSAATLADVDRVCLDFERHWREGGRPEIANYVDRLNGQARAALLRELLALDVDYRRRSNEHPTPEDYHEQFPHDTTLVCAALDRQGTNETPGARSLSSTHHTTHVEQELPSQLGRYQILGRLGAGGFGAVYRAFDTELERDVAIKVPHIANLDGAAALQLFLREARVLATLDHSGIVPVYDVGSTTDAPPIYYVVSKYMLGGSLADHIEQHGQLTLDQAANAVEQVAAALHYAHKAGLVHRDVKLSNILLDGAGQVRIADFGLAIRDEEISRQRGLAGTPSNMSPEQARGEGHLIDGRTDIYSLGVVLYELLAASKPFDGIEVSDLLEQIKWRAPKPLRQIDDAIPKELERICLKALAKRPSDRYSTALDFASDLHAWAAAPQHELAAKHLDGDPLRTEVSAPRCPPASARAPIVPKGLRPFDETDQAFFLDLLPGPRDRDGLPDIVRFWKSKIEETNPERTFRVGAIYGPSGSGKSSLIRAAILPLLGPHVTPVYVPADRDDTQQRIVRAIRAARQEEPGLVTEEPVELAELLKSLRLHGTSKLLLVIDQFEQWLHTAGETEFHQFTSALRQCDGPHVQCLLLVRDDFWMALSRFMHQLEVPLHEYENSVGIDLFDAHHAIAVLTQFGRAFGRLPPETTSLSRRQQRFLEQAVTMLQEDGKVIPVKLNLFVELTKTKPWEPSTLKDMGGTQGLGVTFLNDTFCASNAPAGQRIHEVAARRVLKSLLPDELEDLKGRVRSRDELLGASRYQRRPQDFDSLLRLLDQKLRLITPVQQSFAANEDSTHGQQSHAQADGHQPAEPAFQLTHDYLVGSVRQWLSSKQRETMRGRAELCLDERTALWTARPEPRQLPGIIEWLRIGWWTDRSRWTSLQQRLMSKATLRHTTRIGVLVSCCALAIWGASVWIARIRAQDSLRALASAQLDQVLPLIGELPGHGAMRPQLQRALVHESLDETTRLKLHLALLSQDSQHWRQLTAAIQTATPSELMVIRQAFLNFITAADLNLVIGECWDDLKDPQRNDDQRLRLGGLLAALDPECDQWETVADDFVRKLVTESLTEVPVWLNAFRPVRQQLIQPLEDVFRTETAGPIRMVAATALGNFLSNDPARIVELLKVAQPLELDILIKQLRSHPDAALEQLNRQLDESSLSKLGDRDAAKWKDPEEALVQTIEQSEGIVTERFAFCHALPLEDFEAAAAKLRAAAYRPVRCRPYAVGTELLVAAIWTRDALEWQLVTGLSADAVQRKSDALRAEGLRPLDAAGYFHEGQWHCAVIWVGDRFSQQDWRLSLLLPAKAWQTDFDTNLEAGLTPQTTHVARNLGRESRRCQVWLRNGPRRFYRQRSGSTFDDNKQFSHVAGTLLVDLSVYQTTPHQVDYSAVWHRELQVESRVVWRPTVDAHLSAARELVRDGLQPASLSVCQPELGGPRVAVSVWQQPINHTELVQREARAKANLAVALLQLEGFEAVRPLLRLSMNPLVRSMLLERMALGRVDPRELVDALQKETDGDIRQAILLALAEYDLPRLDQPLRERSIALLTGTHHRYRDAATRSACRRLWRNWNLAAPADQKQPPDSREPGESSTNSEGHVMVNLQIPNTAPTRKMRPASEQRRTVAIASTEVTVAQFLRFRPDHDYDRKLSPQDDSPVTNITALDAIAYCQWLNRREGIPADEHCYLPNSDNEFAEGLQVVHGFLARSGYRLPTIQEWKLAANRQGAVGYGFGDDGQLLPRYAWYASNSDGSTHPVETLIPNSQGLFNMLGNVAEWCQPSVVTDTSDVTFSWIGGHFNSTAWQLRDMAAATERLLPETSGFRIARTVIPQSGDLLELAHGSAAQEDWKKVVQLLRRSKEQSPDEYPSRCRLAWVELYLGNTAEYRKQCSLLMAQYKDTLDPSSAHAVALTSVLSPDSNVDLSIVLRMAERNAQLGEGVALFQRVLGMTYFRLGRHAEAEDVFDDVLPIDYPGRRLITLFFQAMNYHALGKIKEARSTYEQAVGGLKQLEVELPDSQQGMLWRNIIYCRVLQREAAAMWEAAAR